MRYERLEMHIFSVIKGRSMASTQNIMKPYNAC